MSGARPLPDLGLGTTPYRRRSKPVPGVPGVVPRAQAEGQASAAAPAVPAASPPALGADGQLALVARIDRRREALTKVVAELRAVEKRTRHSGPSAEDAALLRRLRSDESSLHREIAGMRAELDRLRGARPGD